MRNRLIRSNRFHVLASIVEKRATRSRQDYSFYRIVGFEVEYSDTSEHAKTNTAALQSSMFNLLVQTPFPVSRLQLYGTIGGGLYRERIGIRANTGLGGNIGAGLKISLVGPIRVRIDYRTFRLRHDSTDRSRQRVYAGLNIAF